MGWFHGLVEVWHGALTIIEGRTQDWGVALVILTLGVRMALSFIHMNAAKQSVRQHYMQIELKEMKGQAVKVGTAGTAMLEQTSKLYAKYGIKPIFTLGAALVQLPIFMSMYRLFTTYGNTMTSHLVPWVSSLGHYDLYHVVPLLSAMLMAVSSMLPIIPEMAAAGSTLSRIGVPLLVAVVYVAFAWWAPVAVALYGLTNTVFVLIERGFYRTSIGRNLVLKGLPAHGVISR